MFAIAYAFILEFAYWALGLRGLLTVLAATGFCAWIIVAMNFYMPVE